MEQAASALAQAVETSEEEEEEKERAPDQPEPDKILVVAPQAKQQWRKTTGGESDDNGGASAVTIDALVSVLQDPDRGVPRALETRLKDVKIRRGERELRHLFISAPPAN